MNAASILFKIRTIDASRRSRSLSAVFGRTLSFGNAMGVKTAVYGLTAVLLYVLPAVVLMPRSAGTIEVSRLVVDGSCVALFFLGLFIGANLVFDTTIAENQGFLALPITVNDLARFRSLEAFSILGKTSFFLLTPLVWVDLLLDGANGSALGLGLVVSQTAFAISYLFGIVLLLLVLRRRPWIKPDRLFLGVFLASVWALVLVKQVHRFPRLAAVLALPFGIVERTFERVSPARLIETAVVSSAPPIVVFLLSTGAAVCVGILLFGVIRDLLYFLYRGEHDEKRRRFSNEERRLSAGPLIGYSVLCRWLRHFPVRVRAGVAKDVLLMIRNPSRAVQMLVFLLVIWFVPRLWPGGASSSGLLSGYLAGSFIVFKLLIDSIGLERGNIHLIRRLMPGRFEYLGVRIGSGLVVSGLVALPAAVVVISTGSGFGPASTAVPRLLLVFANIFLSIVLVTGYSAYFARFETGGFTAGDLGISPIAMLGYWAVGIWGPVLFFNLDRWTLQGSAGAGWIALAFSVPALIPTGVFLALGDMRIRGVE